MNQLTKLIEQYESQTGKKAKVSIYDINGVWIKWEFSNDFVLWLASRPTCGEEQRKFLDEIEKMSEYIPPRKTYDRMEISASIIGSDDKDPYCYELWQCDFTADLSKVIRGE